MNKINTKLLFAYILFAFLVLILHTTSINSYPVGACDIENCEDEIAEQLDDEEVDPCDYSDNEKFPNDFIENILDDSESRHPKGRPPDTADSKDL
ncbi:5615_t:CDS:2 [Funneliformis caledonium]|uniref:5615_t:CDS:1 n=1 Tax=Funneliformis caledonium TaxID=1117310 RepID=A0A9N9FSY2_9GLOM|nr:5615_t:CDS:2 [Funneliformis caledonium]